LGGKKEAESKETQYVLERAANACGSYLMHSANYSAGEIVIDCVVFACGACAKKLVI